MFLMNYWHCDLAALVALFLMEQKVRESQKFLSTCTTTGLCHIYKYIQIIGALADCQFFSKSFSLKAYSINFTYAKITNVFKTD